MQKRSHKRDAIYDVIYSTNTHPSAEWIYNQAKQDIPDLSLATVYRNLTLFREKGKAVSVAVVNGQGRFDANTEPHPHFVCTNCDAVIDIDCSFANFDLEKIEKECGFKVSSQVLLVYGLCSDCRE